MNNDNTKMLKVSQLEEAKKHLRLMYDAAVKAVMPSTVIEEAVEVNGNMLRILNKDYDIDDNVYLIGFGKAVIGMAATLERKLSSHLKRGIISVPLGTKNNIWKMQNFPSLPTLTGVVDCRECCIDNQPDNDSLLISHDILDLVEELGENDMLIVLISGGGSAQLFMPRPTITVETKLKLCKRLQNCGATIQELNTLRKKLSMVKGGGLARMAYPARTIGLILSDIVGDPIDLIASGPTVYSDKNPEDVIQILKRYNLYEDLEDDVKTLLSSKETQLDMDLVNKDRQFTHCDNFVIGNNSIAIEAAKRESLRMGVEAIILRKDIIGDVQTVSEGYSTIAKLMCEALDKRISREDFVEQATNCSIISSSIHELEEMYDIAVNTSERGIVLIGGGEPTVVIHGSGKGGRNQELALRFAIDWCSSVEKNSLLSNYDVTFLSAGSDGQDGPTDAAGAYGYANIVPTVHNLLKILRRMCKKEILASSSKNQLEGMQDKSKANYSQEETSAKQNRDENSTTRENVKVLQTQLHEAEKLEPIEVLRNNDSYNFYTRFKHGSDLLKVGVTGTNVMDLHFIMVKKRQCNCQIDFHKNQISDPLNEHDLRSVIHNEQTERNENREVIETSSNTINLNIVDASLSSRCCVKKNVIDTQ